MTKFVQDKQFAPVEACDVIGRDGPSRVSKFSVSVYPVTIGDFNIFCAETGYLTDAERVGSEITYRSDPELLDTEGKTGVAIKDQGASMVSYNDAFAFCEWAEVRIPTDAEWVAASVVDWTTIYRNATRGYQANYKRGRIKHHGYEWTSSLADETQPPRSVFELGGNHRMDLDTRPLPDDVTVRYGPVYALFDGWQTAPFTMRAPRGFFSERIAFRAVIRE
jgi:hypothetical protein